MAELKEKVINAWREGRRKGLLLHKADIAHYDKRLAEYDRLKERLDDLDPLKDYAEINVIQYKLRVIIEDFNQISRLLKERKQ